MGQDPRSGIAKTAFEMGSAIRGEKITAQCRKTNRVTVTHGSSTHNIQRMMLEGSVLCVIERPLNFLRELPGKN